MSLIECKNVKLGYEGQAVLNNINLQINGGEYIYIIGENGAGKSTLVKGLLKIKKPMEGQIIYSDGLKHKEIGYMPQQTIIQKDFPASVMEVVISGRLNRLGLKPFFTIQDKKDALEKMEMMGISDLKNKCYHDLSGGQQQRVLLARAMCATKKVILLDEPVAGLDPQATAELYDLIARINSEFEITVIMVSHDLDATRKYASHIIHISKDGFFFGTKEEFNEL